MSTPDAEGVMSRVMKLLSLANDEGATPHERELAEERAERLMAQHMIDRFEANERLKRTGNERRKPIMTQWAIQFDEMASEEHGRNYEFQYQLISVFKAVVEHCNCRIDNNYSYKSGNRIYKIVGFPEDIAYAERIWFNVFKTFVRNINPSWDKTKSVGENAFNFASAGLSWQQICLKAEAAKDPRVPAPDRWQDDDPDASFYLPHETYNMRAGDMITKDTAPDPKRWNFGLGKAIPLLRGESKKYAAEHKAQFQYARGSELRVASRNSFAQSYTSTIRQRLRQLMEETTKDHTGEQTVDANKYALARRDTREQVDEEFYRLFPEYDPEVQRKKQEEAEFLRACIWAALTPEEQKKILRDELREQKKWERRAAKARTSYRAVREQPRDRYDAAAWSRGQKAAQSVNLRADSEVHNQPKGEIS